MKESLKPIKLGCLAMVIGNGAPEIDGKVVRSLRAGRRGHSGCSGRFWRTEPKGPTGSICSCILMRIDPDDEIREEQELELWGESLDSLMRKAGVWEG